MKRLILYLLAALAAGVLLFGWGYRRGAASVAVEETTRIDTVFYPRPEPLPGTYRLADISVPVLLFAPPDTVTETVVVKVGADSVQMKVAMETRPYSDSTYRAQVSGPRIGNLRPTLDWIETYNRTTTQQQVVTRRSRFALTAGVGAAYTPQGFQPTVGVGVGIILWQF